MADYYYATITYRSGDKVRLIHKGHEPTKATMRLLGRIGALIMIGGPVPQETAQDAEKASAGIDGDRRAGWHPQMDVPEADDE